MQIGTQPQATGEMEVEPGNIIAGAGSDGQVVNRLFIYETHPIERFYKRINHGRQAEAFNELRVEAAK